MDGELFYTRTRCGTRLRKSKAKVDLCEKKTANALGSYLQTSLTVDILTEYSLLMYPTKERFQLLLMKKKFDQVQKIFGSLFEKMDAKNTHDQYNEMMKVAS
jgi:hypothetical protein